MINKNNLNFDKQMNIINNNIQMNNNNKTNNNILNNKNENDISSVRLNSPDLERKILFKNNSISHDKFQNISKNNNNVNILKKNNNIKGNQIKKSSKSIEIDNNKKKNNDNNNKNSSNKKNLSSNLSINIINHKNENHSHNSDTNNVITFKIKTKTRYLKKQLFPYKYYLCSIFIKNPDITNNTFCFTKKFIVVYHFICQLFDISSYLILQREFQTMKNTVIEEKQRNIIEKEHKINVNERYFNMNMQKCLEGKRLSIFGKTPEKSSKNVRTNILMIK